MLRRVTAGMSPRWTIHPLVEELKVKARAAGLWNLWMTQGELVSLPSCGGWGDHQVAVCVRMDAAMGAQQPVVMRLLRRVEGGWERGHQNPQVVLHDLPGMLCKPNHACQIQHGGPQGPQRTHLRHACC
jgi:hypothetical protein